MNSDSPNNSVLSTETSTSSDSCYASGDVEETDKEEEEDLSEEKESLQDKLNRETTDVEVPTLRRKKDRGTAGTRQGPRVTRNLTEEQIMSQLQDACVIASPWLYYDKVYRFLLLLIRITVERKKNSMAKTCTDLRCLVIRGYYYLLPILLSPHL